MGAVDAKVVDLFCGVGGLSHGFALEGFDVAAGIDADGSCRYAYEANNSAKFIEKRVEDIEPGEIAALLENSRWKIVAGCAPCRPYSSNAPKKNDTEWKLLEEFADLVADVEPHVVTMENVTQLRSYKGGEVLGGFVERLEEAGFDVWSSNVYCPDYGIPQARRRLVLLASRLGPIRLIKPTHAPADHPKVQDVIGHLKEIEAGGADPDDPVHASSALSSLNIRRIEASRPGGTWEDWDEEMRAPCHRKASGGSYLGYYGRMQWDEPSPTITTQFNGYGSGRFGHPEQNRAISIREGAILQTFPADYRFVRPGEQVYLQTLARHIGNAVPVRLGQVIARSIAQHLAAYGS